jgi:inosose dehydratase
MTLRLTRRSFLSALGAAAAASALPSFAAVHAAKLKFGYAAITWGNAERQGIDDIAAVGYKGIQLRAPALKEFTATELKDLLAQHKLTFTALSSGDVTVDKPAEDQIATHAAHAQFVRDAGGLYMQILDTGKPYPRTATADECVRLAKLLTELGKRTADIGIPLAYHNHMNTLSEHPQNLDIIMENSDPKYVKLLLDTGHMVAGGGDPAKAIDRYHERMIFLHLKDVVEAPGTAPGRYPFKWMELGRGKVDFAAVFAALDRVRFNGWAVVELDSVPEPGRTPKESAVISRDYLEQKFGFNV